MIMKLVRRILAVACGIVLLTAVPASASVTSTRAVAVGTAFNRNAFDLQFVVAHDAGPTATAYNFALARSTGCNGCRTVAIAVQIDLVSANPSYVNATNSTQASNINCIACTTVAAAHQFIVTSPGTVSLTPAGSAALDGIRQQLAALRSSSADGATLDAQIDALMSQVAHILQTETVSVGYVPQVAARGVTLDSTLPNGQSIG
jgi:hypothetical protein